MIAATEVPARELAPHAAALPAIPRGLAARALARAYLRSVSACWRGDADGSGVEPVLASFWSPLMPPVPSESADAVSPHGGGGRGIRWYETATAVLGYVGDTGGGYRVPIEAIPYARPATGKPAIAAGTLVEHHQARAASARRSVATKG